MAYELIESRTITFSEQDPLQKPFTLTRRRIDTLFVAAGAVVAIVLAVVGGLLAWGSPFIAAIVAFVAAAVMVVLVAAGVFHLRGHRVG